MSMAIDSKKILDAAKKGGSKKTYSFTIDEAVGEDFKRICDAEGVSYSSVAERLLQDFVGSYKDKKKK